MSVLFKMSLFVLFSLLFCCQPVIAQDRVVSGVVTHAEDETPLPGVTVMLKGTTRGTITDFNGAYSIRIDHPGDTLMFSFVGMQSREVIVDQQQTVDVAMVPELAELDEIVITAMGIKRDKKALSYATQDMKGDEVESSGQQDVAKVLRGKIAGVTVKQTSGMPGASSQVLVRGSSSLLFGNQPLYVIDGMPVEASSPFEKGTGGTGFSDRSLDINPDDIASINVLKGPSAAALYGLRASNGVVVITTKSGPAAKKSGQNTIVSFHSSYQADVISRLPDLQDEYAQGENGKLDLYSPYSWGPEINKLQPYQSQEEFALLAQSNITNIDSFPIYGSASNAPAVYDNVRDFFQTGHTYKNSVNISTASELGSYSLGFGSTNQSGVIPTTGMNKYNTKFNGLFDLNDKLALGVSANYTNLKIDKVPSGNDPANPLFSLYPAPRSYDLTNKPYETEDNPYIQRHYRRLVDNPYWSLAHNKYQEKNDRIFGNVHFSYDPWEWLNVSYRVGIDHFANLNKSVQQLGSGSGRAYPFLGIKDLPDGGEVHDIFYVYNSINSNLIFTATKRFTDDLRVDARLGNEIYDWRKNIIETIGSEIKIGGYDNVNGTANQVASENLYHKRGFAYFSEVTIDYKNMLFLTPSVRMDIVSNMPPENRSFLYPSVGSGFIFTKIPVFEPLWFLDYGKLRFSYAQVGQDGDLYATRNFYSRAIFSSGQLSSFYSFPFNDQTAFMNSSTLYSDDLEPINTQTYETGIDMRFFKNRLGIDYTFYISNSVNQIFRVPIPASSGYEFEYRNAGVLQTIGHEIILNGMPIKSKHFSWDITTNFSSSMSMVKSLSEGVERIAVGSNFTSVGTFGYEGYAYPVIYGTKFIRDDEGNKVMDSREKINGADNPFYGMPLLADNQPQGVLAEVNPDFELSLINTLNYKRLTLMFQIDWRQGGYMHSGLNSLLDIYGMSAKTENRGETSVLNGVKGYLDEEGELVVEGKNDVAIEKGKVYYDEVLWNIAEAYIYETSFVRLRNLRFEYQLPKRWLRNVKAESASLYFSGSNLFLLTRFPNFDPESSTSTGNATGGLEYVALPNTRSFGGGVKLTF